MKFKIAERVYHRRQGKFGTILSINPIKAELVWEHNEKSAIVEVADLIPGSVAERGEHLA